MRAEDVWRLPQSLRDGWRRRFERPSESHGAGRILNTGDAQTSFLSFLLFRRIVVHLLLSPHPISSPCTRRAPANETPHTHTFPFCFSFFSSFPFSTSQRIPVQFWSCRKDEQHLRDHTCTPLRAMNRIYKKHAGRAGGKGAWSFLVD